MVAKRAVELNIEWFDGFSFWRWLPFTLPSTHPKPLVTPLQNV